ncbi:MAG: hypothetical protein H6733_11790 [Alphaproteobacteria bacterium]|nr:hypothetical protein [Alphaproteobacteria bacterium]
MRAVPFVLVAAVACGPHPYDEPAVDPPTSAIDTQLPLPQGMSFFMDPSPLVAGRWIDLEVLGTAPGAVVGIAVSNGVAGTGSCPTWLGGCLDITPGTSGYRFIVLGTADALGRLEAHATLPRTLAAGPWSFQALSQIPVFGTFVASAPQTVDVLPFRANCLGDDPYENDDAPSTATSILVGHTSTDRVLCDQDDIDWHAIDLRAAESITVHVDADPTEGDVVAYVLDTPTSNHASVLQSSFLAGGRRGLAHAAVPFTAPATGRYYVAVRLFDDAGTTPGNVYDLSVTRNVSTCSLGFDDAYAVYGHGADPTAYYGAYGVQFSMTSGFGLVGGVANGDPGHWSSDPAAVPDAAWGCFDTTNTEINTIAFASPASGFTATAYAGNTGSPQTLIVEGFYQGTSVGWTPYVLDYAGPISQTISVPGPVDSIQFNIQSGSLAYAIDDIVYDAALPCP